MLVTLLFYCFFFNDTATTEIYTLSLHDALPICDELLRRHAVLVVRGHERVEPVAGLGEPARQMIGERSEEHTSELQSRQYLVCRLLLEKKKIQPHPYLIHDAPVYVQPLLSCCIV